MSYINKILRAIKIKMMLNRLSVAKENAMREFLGLPPKISWFTECKTRSLTCIKDKCCQIFLPCCVYDRNRRMKRLSCLSSPLFKELVGFMAGILMTLIVYAILIYQLDVTPIWSSAICGVGGFITTMLMAFSQNVRCIVLLMLPQMFSGKGRMLLLMYALWLAMNHPLQNINRNIQVMSDSTTCGQEMALNETKELVKAAAAPIESIMNSIEGILHKLVQFSNFLRGTYGILKKTISQLGGTIDKVGQWLASMVDRCNEKLGQPYRKCRQKFDDAKNECRGMDWVPGPACDLVGGCGVFCNILKITKLLCLIVEAISKLLGRSLNLPAVKVLDSARAMFYFNISIDYHFNYTITQSKSYKNVKDDIKKEIHMSLDKFIDFIGVLKNVMVIMIIFVIVKALVYRSKWLSKDRYDNIYITFTVRDLEERRTEKGKPGILPLNWDEKGSYLTSLSGFMVSKELRKLAFGLVLFVFSFFNAAFYLFCDYGLYSALSLINTHFSLATKTPVPPHTKLHVVGEGPMSDMYRSIVGMFDPLTGNTVKVDVSPCIPHPSEPDWGIYQEIGIIYTVCLILTITEAYGLRLRHIIMACYFPRRERKRAIWLYNHILKLRGGIMQKTAKDIRKRGKGELDPEHISVKGRLAASFPILERIFKCLGWDVKSCLYCGREGKPDDYANFIHCAYMDCDALYCVECYADLDNICPVCTHAVDTKMGDSSDEEDSSIDERQLILKTAQKTVRSKKVADLKAKRRPSKMMADIRKGMGFGGPGGPGPNKRGGGNTRGGPGPNKRGGGNTRGGPGPNKRGGGNTRARDQGKVRGRKGKNDKTKKSDNVSKNNVRHYNPISEDRFQHYRGDAIIHSVGRILPDENITYNNQSNSNRRRADNGTSRRELSTLPRYYSQSLHRLNRNTNAVPFMSNHHSPYISSSESEFISDTTVDTDDLDFDYQFDNKNVVWDSNDSQSDVNNESGTDTEAVKKSKHLDLIPDDIFSSSGDSSSDDDSQPESDLVDGTFEPQSIVISRT